MAFLPFVWALLISAHDILDLVPTEMASFKLVMALQDEEDAARNHISRGLRTAAGGRSNEVVVVGWWGGGNMRRGMWENYCSRAIVIVMGRKKSRTAPPCFESRRDTSSTGADGCRGME